MSGVSYKGPSRSSTHVGTGGEVGASFAILEKNWHCADCDAENYARRPKCFRCKASKPNSTLVESEALLADMKGSQPWREAMDPTSNMIYYYNIETNETQWERPAIMGPAPLATGYWGRGNAAATLKYKELDERYRKRPARKQVDKIESKHSTSAAAHEYNIWYGRHQDYNKNKGLDRDEKAETRCVVETDAGYTKADTSSDSSYLCLHFARGGCALGALCRYAHRIPTPRDEALIDSTKDIFGRDRHSSHKDDMSGTGSFQTNTRTLYVGGLKKKDKQDLKKVVEKHFEEWGEIENVNVIYRLSIAFVRYRLRVNSEFAREAMSHQSLDSNEILNVRWAYEDPNPVAKEAALRANQDAVLAALQSRGVFEAEERAQKHLKRSIDNIEQDNNNNSDSIEIFGPQLKKAKVVMNTVSDDIYINGAVTLDSRIGFQKVSSPYIATTTNDNYTDNNINETIESNGPITEGQVLAEKQLKLEREREDKLEAILSYIDNNNNNV